MPVLYQLIIALKYKTIQVLLLHGHVRFPLLIRVVGVVDAVVELTSSLATTPAMVTNDVPGVFVTCISLPSDPNTSYLGRASVPGDAGVLLGKVPGLDVLLPQLSRPLAAQSREATDNQRRTYAARQDSHRERSRKAWGALKLVRTEYILLCYYCCRSCL